MPGRESEEEGGPAPPNNPARGVRRYQEAAIRTGSGLKPCEM